MRSRKRIFEVAEKSFAIPSAIVADGKSIELKAATEPLIPIKKIPKSAIARNNKTFGGAFLKLKGFPPLANHAVKVRNASKIKVFIKCAAIQKGLAAVKVSAVLPVKTKPAPSRPSMTTKTNEPITVNNKYFSFASAEIPIDKRPDDERDNKNSGERTRDAVRKFDDGF